MISLTNFDHILVNTSAGKDSQVMLQVIVEAAIEQGVLDRVVAVHCDLGRAEWKGVAELAAEQCAHYGVPLRIVKRPQGDLVDQIRARGMFPSSTARYCTSDQKRGQVHKVFTALVKESGWKKGDAPVRILNCMGLRMQESSSREKKLSAAFLATGDFIEANAKASNSKRQVVDFHPIADWTEDEVWVSIRKSGVRHHEAYDLGMPRLSCAFCVFAPKPALMIAGRANPELLDEYVALEQEIGHTFKHKFSIREIRDAINAGEQTETGPISWADVG